MLCPCYLNLDCKNGKKFERVLTSIGPNDIFHFEFKKNFHYLEVHIIYKFHPALIDEVL